jgi:apolipoprotein D and lipocalin family protein
MLAGCAQIPNGVEPVRGFEPERYLGTWHEARGRARFRGPRDVAELEVSFFGPFYGGYNVVDLDAAYSIVLVAGPTRSYLWILSRRPDPAKAEVGRLVARARDLGFDVSALVYVSHGS